MGSLPLRNPTVCRAFCQRRSFSHTNQRQPCALRELRRCPSCVQTHSSCTSSAQQWMICVSLEKLLSVSVLICKMGIQQMLFSIVALVLSASLFLFSASSKSHHFQHHRGENMFAILSRMNSVKHSSINSHIVTENLPNYAWICDADYKNVRWDSISEFIHN